MKIENNILHGPPMTEVPSISMGQYLFNCLRSNGDQIVQVNQLSKSAMKNRLISAMFVGSVLFAILLAHLPVTLSNSASIEDHLPIIGAGIKILLKDIDHIQTGKHYTCKDILEKSTILSVALRNYGINVEDRISIAAENHPYYMVSICSTLFVGATFAPLNPAYTEREYKHMLEICQPRVLFVSRHTENILAKIASTVSWSMKIIELDDKPLDGNIITLDKVLEKYQSIMDPYTFSPVQIDNNRKRMAAILCSSGTTGFPKGVTLSHRNILLFIQNLSVPESMDIRRGDRILLFLPLFHGYGLGMMSTAISYGAIVYIMRNFKLETLISSTEKYRITHMPLVPPVLVGLAKHPMVPNYDFSSVRELLCGAASYPLDVADEVKRRTKLKVIRNGYGMTELSIVSNLSDRTSNDNSVGPILPGFKCKVVNVETGEALAARQIGEVCFAGDQLMLGYYKNPKTTAETIDKENWLHTGDLGYFDEEGSLYITGRIKEVIKYKGFQVSPSEIEAVILSHPSVKDVAVMGKPDKLSGEVPIALVVRQPDKTISAKEIVDFANENLSPQKWLRGGVKFIEHIPKTPSGKIIRRELVNMAAKL